MIVIEVSGESGWEDSLFGWGWCALRVYLSSVLLRYFKHQRSLFFSRFRFSLIVFHTMALFLPVCGHPLSISSRLFMWTEDLSSGACAGTSCSINICWVLMVLKLKTRSTIKRVFHEKWQWSLGYNLERKPEFGVGVCGWRNGQRAPEDGSFIYQRLFWVPQPGRDGIQGRGHEVELETTLVPADAWANLPGSLIKAIVTFNFLVFLYTRSGYLVVTVIYFVLHMGIAFRELFSRSRTTWRSLVPLGSLSLRNNP